MSQYFREYFCAVGIEERKNMPLPVEMSDFINKAQSILQKMELQSEKMDNTREFHEKQLSMYRETIDSQMQLYDKRMTDNDRRWEGLRGTVYTVIGVLFATVFLGGISLSKKATTNDVGNTIKEELKRGDYTSKGEVYNGMSLIIEDNYENLESAEAIDHNTARGAKKELLQSVEKTIRNESYRGIEKE